MESKSQLVALHNGNFQIAQRSLLSSSTLSFFSSVKSMCFSGNSDHQLLMLPLTRFTFSPSQPLTQMLKAFVDSKICVNERNCGISNSFLLEHIAQQSVPSDRALASVSTQPESDTQAIVNSTQLFTEEAVVCFVYEPVAEDTADAVILS